MLSAGDFARFSYMNLVATIQLRPTPAQAQALRETLERCNEACDWISARAWEAGVFRRFLLHKIVYYEARRKFGLSANLTMACIAKVARAYKAARSKPKTFSPLGALPYYWTDSRFMCADKDVMSIGTGSGRQKIKYVCGSHQRGLLAHTQGERLLIFQRGKWYMAVSCRVPDLAPVPTQNFLGVDFGIVNLAYDSQGRAYTGADVERVRGKLAKRKAGLQRRATKAAKRRLKKLSGKEARFRKHVNHCIAKEIVANAERTQLAIALEDLTGIQKRVKASKARRNRLHSWSFAQLRSFVTYKANMRGIQVVAVNPRDTSRTCPSCGTVDKANRKTQAVFSCISCGHTGPADFVAATNIASVARVAISVRPEVLAVGLVAGQNL